MPRIAKTTPETCTQIAQEYAAGQLTMRELARKYHHTDATIRGVLKDAGVAVRHGGEVVYNVPALVGAYAAGATLKDLALQFGGHEATVRKTLTLAGVTIESGRRKTEMSRLECDSFNAAMSTVLERYRSGVSIGAIAQEFGVSPWFVRKALQREGEPLHTRGPQPKYATGRQRHLAVKYGITEAVYEQLLAAQQGVCAICGVDASHARNSGYPSLCVDHCHETQKVRGLLCVSCNSGLGQLQDRLETLTRALAYLTNWPAASSQFVYTPHVNRHDMQGGRSNAVITDEHASKLATWVTEQRTVVYMAEQLGVTHTTVHKALRRFGLYTKKETLADRLTPFLPQIQQGMMLDAVAAHLGVGVPTIRATMSAMGVSLGSLRTASA